MSDKKKESPGINDDPMLIEREAYIEEIRQKALDAERQKEATESLVDLSRYLTAEEAAQKNKELDEGLKRDIENLARGLPPKPSEVVIHSYEDTSPPLSIPLPPGMEGCTYDEKLGLFKKPNPDMLDGFEYCKVSLMGPGKPPGPVGSEMKDQSFTVSKSINIPNMEMKPERKLEVDRPLIQQAIERTFDEAHSEASFYGCNAFVIVVDSQGGYQFKYQGLHGPQVIDILLKVTSQIHTMLLQQAQQPPAETKT